MNKQIKSKLIELSKKYKIQLLVLFGSRAQGKNREDSDYDFAILTQKNQSSDTFFDILNEIEIICAQKIDLINLNKEEDPLLLKNIFQNSKCIFENKKGLYDTLAVNAIYNYIDYSPLYKIEQEIVENKLAKL